MDTPDERHVIYRPQADRTAGPLAGASPDGSPEADDEEEWDEEDDPDAEDDDEDEEEEEPEWYVCATGTHSLTCLQAPPYTEFASWSGPGRTFA